MSFVNPLLLAGTSLVAIPIVLHLMMRRKPRHFEFPAIRFLQKRHDVNQRRLRLRHLVLLALRALAILLLAAALARLIAAPDLRDTLAAAALKRLRERFSHETGLRELAALFGLAAPRPARALRSGAAGP